MQGIDYVISLAAMWLLHCKDYPRTAFDVNIAGTFNILEACVNNNIKKLIWSSSASVYGDALEIPMTEEHPFNNKNFYGASKIAGEAMATAFNDPLWSKSYWTQIYECIWSASGSNSCLHRGSSYYVK